MKRPKTRTSKNILYADKYSHAGVQRLIKYLMDSQGISQFTVANRAGLNPGTIYQILNKTEKQVSRPPRASTLTALAQSIGAELVFDSKTKTFTLYQDETPKTPHKDLNILLVELAGMLVKQGKTKLKKEERERIIRVVGAVV